MSECTSLASIRNLLFCSGARFSLQDFTATGVSSERSRPLYTSPKLPCVVPTPTLSAAVTVSVFSHSEGSVSNLNCSQFYMEWDIHTSVLPT